MSLRTLQGCSYPFIWIKGLLRYFNNLTPLKSFDSLYPVMRFIAGEGKPLITVLLFKWAFSANLFGLWRMVNAQLIAFINRF